MAAFFSADSFFSYTVVKFFLQLFFKERSLLRDMFPDSWVARLPRNLTITTFSYSLIFAQMIKHLSCSSFLEKFGGGTATLAETLPSFKDMPPLK